MSVSTKTKNRLTVMLVAGIPLLLTAISTWLWVFVVKGDIDLVGMLGTRNHGNLINPPIQISDFKVTRVDGSDYQYDAELSQWAFVVNISSPCDTNCQETLYVVRQAHSALGKEARRIRKYVVAGNSEDFAAIKNILDTEYSQYIRIMGNEALLKMLPVQTQGTEPALNMNPRDNFYVVDPSGWIMMQYTEQHSGRQILDDMKFLLKNSSAE
jgi:cytochrome oxidase Cu insertion factor (SCO1/SenC/PrrC family)